MFHLKAWLCGHYNIPIFFYFLNPLSTPTPQVGRTGRWSNWWSASLFHYRCGLLWELEHVSLVILELPPRLERWERAGCASEVGRQWASSALRSGALTAARAAWYSDSTAAIGRKKRSVQEKTEEKKNLATTSRGCWSAFSAVGVWCVQFPIAANRLQ